MQQLIFEAATFCGLGAAVLATMVMIGHGAGLVSLLTRTMVIGGSVFLFAVLGGQVIGRVLLESVAKKELERTRAAEEAKGQAGLKDAQKNIASMQKRQAPKSVKTDATSKDTVRSKAA